MPGALRSAAVVQALLLAGLGSRASAQDPTNFVGIVGGYTSTEQVWSPDVPVEQVGGVAVGAFLNVQAPPRWLSFTAEAVYTQRGSDVVLDVEGTPVPGGVRADYLTLAVEARASLPVGPLRAHLGVGPLYDVLLRSRLDPQLAQAFDMERTAPFGVTAGAGLGGRVRGRWLAEVEARVVEGLQSAYEGDFVSVRNRSYELIVRIGVPMAP